MPNAEFFVRQSIFVLVAPMTYFYLGVLHERIYPVIPAKARIHEDYRSVGCWLDAHENGHSSALLDQDICFRDSLSR